MRMQQYVVAIMATQSEPGIRKLEIKKYANRRYYDTTLSRHLTLDEIRVLIQEGYDVRVTDAKTGDDITAQLLTQIILELETAKLDSFPVPLLLRLIRMNDQLVKDFIEKYFNQALNSFLEYQRQIEEQVRRAQGLPAAFPSVSAWTEAVFKPFVSAMGGSDQGFTGAPPAPAAKEEADDVREMIRNLQAQMADLKKNGKAQRRAKR